MSGSFKVLPGAFGHLFRAKATCARFWRRRRAFQANFTTTNPSTIYATSLIPAGKGRLFVARSEKKGMVWFDNASAKANGADPDGLLGDAKVINSLPGNSITVDAISRLWSGNGSTLMRFTAQLECTITGYGFNLQNRFYLNILGTGGESFTIRSSTDLQYWTTMENTTTVPRTGSSIITWTAPAPPNGPKKFYRLQAQ